MKKVSVVCPSYQDTVFLKPQCHIDQLTAERRHLVFASKQYSKQLHGLHLHGTLELTTTHLFINFLTSLTIRYTNTVFYAKSEAKCNYLRSLLLNTVYLEQIGFPKVTKFVTFENTICTNHKRADNDFDHCSKRKLLYSIVGC